MDEEQIGISDFGEEVLGEFGDADSEEAVGIALGDSLIADPEAFAAIADLNDSRWTIKFLIKQGVPLVAVVKRCLESEHAKELIGELITKLKQATDLLPFLIAITNKIPEKEWEDHDLGEYYRTLVDKRNTLEVKYFLTKGDYRRAWDEVKRVRDSSKIERLRELVRKVYNVLVETGKIKPVTDSTRIAQSNLRPNSNRKDNRPGWEFACELGVKRNDKCVWLFDLSIEGAMVLSLTSYFNKERDERRRQKALENLRKKQDELDDLDHLPSYYRRKLTK